MKSFLYGCILAAGGVFGVSALLSRKWIQVTRTEVECAGLPEALSGLRILHISDLHGNNPKRMNLNIWTRVFSLDFDMAVITGDVVTSVIDEIDPHMEFIERLAHGVPTFYVNGNHERRFPRRMIEKMKRVGVKALDNACEILDINGEKLPIIGLKDYNMLKRYGFGNTGRLFKENPGFKLVLSHQPQSFDRFARWGGFLMLCGHTHGGQVRIPFAPVLVAPGQGILPRYGNGIYKKHGSTMFISRGIGTNIFPLRLFNRPEVAVITLRACSR